MKIGIDLDDTICLTSELIDKYAKLYCLDNKITIDILWNDSKYKDDFLNKNLERIYREVKLKKDAKKVLLELKNKGNKLYIITARSNNYIKGSMANLINEYLKANDIIVDDIIINCKDKREICKNINIDIMLDDNYYNYIQLNNYGIKTIIFDEKNNYTQEINRVGSWENFLNYLKNFQDSK